MKTYIEVICSECGYIGTSDYWLGFCPVCQSTNIGQRVVGQDNKFNNFEMPSIK